MDPVADLDLPPADGGNMASGSAQSHRSASPSHHRSNVGLRDSINNNPPSQRSQAENHVLLRISPAAGSAKFGYIYLSDTERRHEEAITAYFNSAGREVAVLPCPDFEQFIADNNLLYRDLLFVSNLPGISSQRVWTKPEKYAPILSPDSMRLMVSLAKEKHRTLKQGDCKNAFCQGVLPNDKITIVKPPIGDPGAGKDEYWLLKKTLYGLRRSPRHWYNKITLVLSSIGLKPERLGSLHVHRLHQRPQRSRRRHPLRSTHHWTVC